jgi:hypothetical protein
MIRCLHTFLTYDIPTLCLCHLSQTLSVNDTFSVISEEEQTKRENHQMKKEEKSNKIILSQNFKHNSFQKSISDSTLMKESTPHCHDTHIHEHNTTQTIPNSTHTASERFLQQCTLHSYCHNLLQNDELQFTKSPPPHSHSFTTPHSFSRLISINTTTMANSSSLCLLHYLHNAVKCLILHCIPFLWAQCDKMREQQSHNHHQNFENLKNHKEYMQTLYHLLSPVLISAFSMAESTNETNYLQMITISDDGMTIIPKPFDISLSFSECFEIFSNLPIPFFDDKSGNTIATLHIFFTLYSATLCAKHLSSFPPNLHLIQQFKTSCVRIWYRYQSEEKSLLKNSFDLIRQLMEMDDDYGPIFIENVIYLYHLFLSNDSGVWSLSEMNLQCIGVEEEDEQSNVLLNKLRVIIEINVRGGEMLK